MNIKIYFKQAWAMMRQNKLFTSIYVAGTALAIATTMIMAIVYYVKIAPIYPEVNRKRTFFITTGREVNRSTNSTSQSNWSLHAVKDWFYTLKNVEAVSAYVNDWNAGDYIQPTDGGGIFPVVLKATDPNFFRIFEFSFIEGKPFTDIDLQSGLRTAVISDELSQRLFGTKKDVVGQTFSMNYVEYRVVGVVKSASFLCKQAYAHVYVPYTTHKEASSNFGSTSLLGYMCVTLMVKDDAQEDLMREEINELVRKFNASQEEITFSIYNQPRSHLLTVFQTRLSDVDFTWGNVIKQYLLILLVLLLVPALNLSGLIAGRMETRLAEMGVRKSFGANRGGLLWQVIWENLLLTLLGSLLGLVFAWIALFVCREWIFALFDTRPSVAIEGVSTSVSAEMLFAPSVFVIAFLICMVLNLLSAFIPAWNSLRNPIVKSLNEKR